MEECPRLRDHLPHLLRRTVRRCLRLRQVRPGEERRNLCCTAGPHRDRRSWPDRLECSGPPYPLPDVPVLGADAWVMLRQVRSMDGFNRSCVGYGRHGCLLRVLGMFNVARALDLCVLTNCTRS